MQHDGRSRAALPLFFGFTYAVTWTMFFAADALRTDGAGRGSVYLVTMIGVFAPSLVALSLSAWEGGTRAVVALLRRLVLWRVPLRWYVFAAGFMAAIKLTVAVIHRVLLGAWPAFGTERPIVMAIATLLSVVMLGQAGEELGWRGYALPRLATGFGFAWGSVILGVLWASWHLPLFFMLGGDTQGQSFPLYLLQVTAISVAIAFLFKRTGGSLLVTMLMHAAINNTKDIVPSALPGAHDPMSFHASTVGWLTVSLLWIAAGYFFWKMRIEERDGQATGNISPALIV